MGAPQETGRILREARTAAGKTLAGMAQETRINERFLGELEAGTSFSLPAIYRKTFLRTYARALGVDPETFPPDEPPAAAPPATADGTAHVKPDGKAHMKGRAAEIVAAGPPVEEGSVGRLGRNPFAEKSQLRTMVIVVALLVTALYLSVKWFAAAPESRPAPPAPAQEAVPDTLSRATNLPAFTGSPSGASGGGPSADSLVLRAATSESVWVHIVIDNDSTIEYTLPPGYAITLRARDNFLLAVGNPRGLSVYLNGRKLDVLGSGDRPVKNLFLSRKSLTP